MAISELVFVGFNKHVVALDRTTGRLIWRWKSPKGNAYPAILADGDQLFVNVMGYTYCLDPWTGRTLWQNELPGLRAGVACIATSRASTDPRRAAAAEFAAQQAAAAAAAAGSAG
jgi:hypothetical protein